MPDLIVIGGAPGAGKTTLAVRLRDHFCSPWIDFGRLREFHLDRDWKNEGPDEEAMTFENLVFLIRNYVRHGYSNVIVDDLRDHRIQQISSALADMNVRVLTLVLSDPDELRRRIIERNDGWRDTERAVAWNREVLVRASFSGEQKIDVTVIPPEEVFRLALEALGPSAKRGSTTNRESQ